MTAQVITKGKAVYFVYCITTDTDGAVVEQSDIPISYVHGGYSNLIKPVETALEGCQEGAQISVPLTSEESLWSYDPSLTYTDDIENVPKPFRHIGAQVQMTNDSGESRTFLVTKIADGKLTVDGNHLLAGKAITFHITIKTVRDATMEEIKTGRPGDGLSVSDGGMAH